MVTLEIDIIEGATYSDLAQELREIANRIAGKTLNISPSSITECCRGKRKSIGGYIWKYESIWKSNL